ncbi:glycosyltransferase family 4 protein [Maritalea mobilis]|uniref:glycosyltransferase family 4 protein n=1 Tax=Maritalea mobilis TaxID=483324 RepID=UPI001C95FB51|nr:glycosyltransferase family 4 protein [Maritalea mobilis]MBY6202574.1 glycosyltransferase family 4 protein [Maritalea mobilis]
MRKSILVIVKGPPSDDKAKAGLFPVTIRQFCTIFETVYVFSIKDQKGEKAETLNNLGDAIYINPLMAPGTFLGDMPVNAVNSQLIASAVASFCNGKDIDLVLSLQSAPDSGKFAKQVANRLGRPFGSWEHLTSYERKRFIGQRRRLKDFFRKADGIAAVSEPVLSHIQSNFGVTLKNSVAIPNPAPEDIESSEPVDTTSFESYRKSGPMIGAWTKWRKIKRLDILIDAFLMTLERFPDAQLLVAGRVMHEPGPKAQHPNIHFLGHLSRDQVRSLAHAVDFCCVPSDYETFGLPIVEALAAGKPVVATNSDGPKSIMTEDYLGELTPTGDLNSFADAMVQTVERLQDYDAHEIRQFAISRYGKQAQIDRWAAFFDTMTG